MDITNLHSCHGGLLVAFADHALGAAVSRRIWTEPLVAALPKWRRRAGQTAVTWIDLTDETFLVRHRGTLLSVVGQGFGITIIGAALPAVRGRTEPAPFSAIWSPHNQSAMLRNLLDLARRMGRPPGTADIPLVSNEKGHARVAK